MGYTSLSLSDYALTDMRVPFMGLNYDAMDTGETVSALIEAVDRDCDFTYVVTPNVDHLVRLDAEPDLKPLYDQAGVLVCDSRILELLAKFEGKRLPAAPGADIVESLIRHHISPDERIVLIGGDADIIDSLVEDYHLTNIAWHDPLMGLRKNPEAVQRAAEFLVQNNERFAFLCVGSPQQEMIAQAAQAMGGGKGIALCCGASLEFLSGKVQRAPKWMRENRLEWLHRLMSEPGRLWRRYLVDGPRIFRIWMRHRKA